MYSSTFSLALLASTIGLASASCQLKNVISTSKPPSASQFCQPTGAGTYTFSMDVSEVEVPTFNSGAPNAGNVQSSAFIIYDNTCKAVGVYSPHQSNDCGSPYVIEENFLKYVLTVTSVNFDVGSPRFSFNYANGKYSIGNNHCTCATIDHALEGEKGCKCAFPVGGESKRSVEFEA